MTKRIIATFVTLLTLLFSADVAHAVVTPADIEATDSSTVVDFAESLNFDDLDSMSDSLRNFAFDYYSNTGQQLVWAIYSLNNHQDLMCKILESPDTNSYNELVKAFDDYDVDFVQVGSVLSDFSLEGAKYSFETDPIDAALTSLIPIFEAGDVKDEYYSTLKENQIPIYWNITDDDSPVYCLEIAVGKYVIQKGDTLWDIANEHGTTVEHLLEVNSNITNPDVIYSGDYLVVN